MAANASGFTRHQCQDTLQAHRLQNIVMHPGDRDMKEIVVKHLHDCPVTGVDIDVAHALLGPNLGSLKGKTVRCPNPHVPMGISGVPTSIMKHHQRVTIAIDIMFINAIPFLITISHNLHFGTVEVLPNRQEATIKNKLRAVIHLYEQRGFRVTSIMADPEFEPLRAVFPQLNTCGADEHIPEIERFIRTVKDRVRSVYHSLPYKYVPRLLLVHLAKAAVFWLNAFPHRDRISDQSPRYIMTGQTLNFQRHARLELGAYVQTHEEHDNSMGPRTLGAICLGPTGNQQGGHWFLSLTSGARIIHHRWTSLPAPREVIRQVNSMGKHQGMPSTLTFANRVGTEICDAVRDLYNNVSDEGSEFDGDDDSYSAVSQDDSSNRSSDYSDEVRSIAGDVDDSADDGSLSDEDDDGDDNVMTLDIPGAFMQTDIDETIHIRLDGPLVDLLIKVDPSYQSFVCHERGQRVIYTCLNKALYGTLQAAMLFWKELPKFITADLGFTMNPFDSCVANKIIDGKQCTILWHVDDIKMSHVSQEGLESIMKRIEACFGREVPLIVTRRPVHEYLGMTIDFSRPGTVQFHMKAFIDDLIAETPSELLKGMAASPAGQHLFTVNENCSKPSKEQAELFHYLTAKLLYLSKRTRPDIQTAIAFLTTCVSSPDCDDYKKSGRCLKYVAENQRDSIGPRGRGLTLNLLVG